MKVFIPARQKGEPLIGLVARETEENVGAVRQRPRSRYSRRVYKQSALVVVVIGRLVGANPNEDPLLWTADRPPQSK